MSSWQEQRLALQPTWAKPRIDQISSPYGRLPRELRDHIHSHVIYDLSLTRAKDTLYGSLTKRRVLTVEVPRQPSSKPNPDGSFKLAVLASCQQLFDEVSQQILLESFVQIHLEQSNTWAQPSKISSFSAFIHPMLVQNVWIDVPAEDVHSDPIALSTKLMECTSSLHHRTEVHIVIYIQSRPCYVPILHQTMLQSFRSFTSFRTVHIRPVVRIPYGVSPVYREEVASGGNLAAAHFTQQLQMLACMEQLLSPALGKASFGRNEVGSPRWIEFHPRRPQEFDEPAYSPMSHVFHCPLWMPSVWKPSGWREPWEKDYKDPVRSQAEMREAKAREEALVEQGLKSIAGILRDMPELAAGPVWDIVRGRWPARHSDSCMDRLC